MFGKPFARWALVWSFLPLTAMADSGYVDLEHRLSVEQRHATGLDTLSPAQLALLNQLLRDSTPAAPTAPAPPASVFEGATFGADSKPIKARAKGAISAWEPGAVFELDNGQSWKVLKGSLTLPNTLQAPEVLVVPGVAGRWFLQVDEDLPKARVYRID